MLKKKYKNIRDTLTFWADEGCSTVITVTARWQQNAAVYPFTWLSVVIILASVFCLPRSPPFSCYRRLPTMHRLSLVRPSPRADFPAFWFAHCLPPSPPVLQTVSGKSVKFPHAWMFQILS